MIRLIHFSAYLFALVMLSSCAGMYLKSANEAYDNLKYNEAMSLYEKGLSKKEDYASRMRLADSYLKVGRYADAAGSYGIANVDPSMTDKDRISYGKALMGAGKHSEALTIFEGILSREPGNPTATKLASSCRNVGELRSDSALFAVTPVSINLKQVFSPVIANDGLYVTAEKSFKGATDPYTGLSYTDVYFLKNDNGSLGSPNSVNSLNSSHHDGILTISGDGNTMILTRSFYNDGKLGKDGENVNNLQLYQSTKNATGQWSEPRYIPLNDEHYMFAHPTLSRDGKTMYFSSDKEGGFGGMDLYMSSLDATNWSPPVNLGGLVNTNGDEVFPYLASSDTLYFSSDSHTTLGGKDILYSVNRNGSWSTPYHLSYPINTTSDDFGIAFNADHKSGYLSSDRSGADMIYAFEIFNPILTLDGLVTGESSVLPIGGAKVTVMNITDGTEEVMYTDENGTFTADLLPGKNYRVKVEDDGHFTETREVSTINMTSNTDIPLVFEMKELLVSDGNPDGSGTGGNPDGTVDGNNPDGSGNGVKPDGVDEYPYAVPNIYWDYNKWTIRKDSEEYLNMLVKLFRDNSSLRIEIRSHCDCRGSHPFNDNLSQKRAKAVVDYLIAKGVNRSMLVSKGMGERKLVNRCKDGITCSEDEHQENRRTEFLVLQK